MDFVHSPTNSSEFNKYDSGFIKHDLEFESQNLLDQHRSKLISDHFDMSHLQEYTIQFKRSRNNNSNNDDNSSNDQKTDSSEDNKPKLSFDCDFESGNIGEINHYRDNEYDMTIRGDTNNNRHSIWFYFRVKGGIAGHKLVCHITNYSKSKSLFGDGFTPLIRSKTKPIWTRLPEHQVNWFKCNRHRKNCFTFSYTFDRSGDEYFFAYSYPYTYSYLQKFLGDIEKLNLSYCKRQLLARTVQQRRLDCLRIEECDENTPNINDRPAVVFSSRVHPGETPSSYVVHGLIEFLLSDNESAIFLRRNLTIFIIPMLNPDGVFLGNYRCTSLGYDLNRHWHQPDFTQHPTICALKFLLRQLDANNHKLDFYMDLHAHTNATDGFMYCNQSQPTVSQMNSVSKKISTENNNNSNNNSGSSNDNSKNGSMDEPTTHILQFLHDGHGMDKYYQRNDFTTIFPRLLDLHCNEYSFSKTKFCNNPKKAGSARRAMEAILSEIPVCYTFEVSFWKSNIKHSMLNGVNSRDINCYTQETYRNLGRCMIQSLCDMYKLPKDKRNDLSQYNFKSKKFMKGDIRKKLQKSSNNNKNKNIIDNEGKGNDVKNQSHGDVNGNKINVSIPSVPTI